MITTYERRRCLPALLMACSLAAAASVIISMASAKDAESWKVHGKLFGEQKDPHADPDKSKDVSGIACATTSGFPRICLIVDDETQGAQIVIVDDGELTAGQFIRLIYDTHHDEVLELDAEGAAYADGFFYVIGSHGRPRHQDGAEEAKNEAKAAATRRVFRIRFDQDAVDAKTGQLTTVEIKPSAALSRLIKAQADLAPWFDKALEDNGLTIEGVAVRGDRLYAGMRGPVLPDGNAAILSAPLAALFDGQPGEAQLHRVGLGEDTLGNPRGIRDLVAYGAGFLIVAGPVNDPPSGDVEPGDYAIFSYSGDATKKLLDLKAYGKKVKPEGLLPLDEKNGKLRALLLFDGPKEGSPTPIEIDLN
jgi:Protein of unknown function (DUF3616)